MQCNIIINKEGLVMDVQLTVRMPKFLTEKLQTVAKHLGIKKSDVVRMAIRHFLEEEPLEADIPYNRVKDLIGAVHSDLPDLGEKHRDYLVERFKKNA